MASSRVGAIMSARGLPVPCFSSGLLRQWLMIEIRNAAVLPVPVCARPAMSLPLSVPGRISPWIGVACCQPSAWMPRIRRGCRSRSWKRILPSSGSTANSEESHGVSSARGCGSRFGSGLNWFSGRGSRGLRSVSARGLRSVFSRGLSPRGRSPLRLRSRRSYASRRSSSSGRNSAIRAFSASVRAKGSPCGFFC